MRINHNMMAINAHRQLGVNTRQTGKAVEKLSSGLRINRAGDDAAGLAISEKMRSQVRGLNQASRNAQDDISLIQTTEGALNETQAIVHRMREMAVQSANDSNTNDDRAALQAEMDQLAQEVTRIANDTEFNTRKVLNGNLEKEKGGEGSEEGLKFHIGANTNQEMAFNVKAMDAATLGLTRNVKDEVAQGTIKDSDGKAVTAKATAAPVETKAKDGKGKNTILNDFTIKFVEDTSAVDADAKAVVDGKTITITAGKDKTQKDMFDAIAQATDANDGKPGALEADVLTAVKAIAVTGTDASKASTIIGKSISLAGGMDAFDSKAASFETDAVGKINTTDAVAAGGIDIRTQKGANAAIETIDAALKKISDTRAGLGAVQNRLEHTIKNVDTAAENLQAAESRIRDVDMAKEMMNYTKNNILNQAAQAMLAQANQAPQGVLQLLR